MSRKEIKEVENQAPVGIPPLSLSLCVVRLTCPLWIIEASNNTPDIGHIVGPSVKLLGKFMVYHRHLCLRGHLIMACSMIASS